MAVSIELNELADVTIKRHTEDVIRECIGGRAEETWRVWIRSSFGHCQVRLEGPTQTRDRMFFDDLGAIPQKIREWLLAYPLK